MQSTATRLIDHAARFVMNPYTIATLCAVIVAAIVYDWATANPRPPSVQPSFIRTAVICDDAQLKPETLAADIERWTSRGWPSIDIVDTPCTEPVPHGVVQIRRCADGGPCTERHAAASSKRMSGDTVMAATIYLPGRFYNRQPQYLWHELGHIYGIGIKWHDERPSSVMAETAGTSWRGLDANSLRDGAGISHGEGPRAPQRPEAAHVRGR